MLTPSLSTTLPKCLGMLGGRRPGLKLKRFLDEPLHWAGVIGGACYSLHKALFPHSSTPLVLHWRVLHLRSPNFVPGKATNILLRLFCWAKIKKLGDFSSNAVLVMWGQQSRRQGLVEKKISEIRLSIDSDLSQKRVQVHGWMKPKPTALLTTG